MKERILSPNIYNIPGSIPFSTALVSGILSGEIFDGDFNDPLMLNKILIFVPTRRASRNIHESFIASCKNKGTILPRIIPIGDIDEEPQDIGELPLLNHTNIRPAISATRRQLLLTRLLLTWANTYNQRGNASNKSWSMDHLIRLSNELAKFLDSVEIEGLEFSKLKNLAPEKFSSHWQEILEFLQIVTKAWPKILAEEGAIDAVTRRNLVLYQTANIWAQEQPTTPIIIAGSTGTMPAVTALMNTVSRLPQGAIVLPGLDNNISPITWSKIEPNHPQYSLKTLLKNLNINRNTVRLWPAVNNFRVNEARSLLLGSALKPANSSDEQTEINHTASCNLSIAECSDSFEEAGVIALCMRTAISSIKADSKHDFINGWPDHKSRTVALITADRILAQRVAIELQQFDIIIDDSAGISLGQTSPGGILRLTARLGDNNISALELLAALKHPLSSGGETSEDFASFIKDFEAKIVRNSRLSVGISKIRNILNNSKLNKKVMTWTLGFLEQLSRFNNEFNKKEKSLSQIVQSHIYLTEWIVSTDKIDGASKLFDGDDGKEARIFLEAMLENADTISQITYNDYVGLIDSMMEQIVVRRRSKKHPQLFIWGPLEARLQRADIVILGGLNEGTWPPTAPEDPWMSRPMRETFGLPPNDKRIGLSAHDFVQSASAEHLLLTRSNRTNDGPEIASRWLLRLKTQLTKVGLESGPYNRGKEWRALYKQINSTNVVASPIQMPAPCPPINSRPRKLSVTQIERWMGDPYSIYARHILRLKPMQPLEATNDASVRGNIIHEILHTFMKNTGPKLPSDALERLISLGNDVFLDNEIRPGDLAYWWPRFERIAQWFINTENSRLKTAEFLGGEVYGSLELFAPGGNFVLTAKADRIDLLSDGSLSIIDYKTGVMPNGMQVRSGKAPQLPLEGAIAAAGGFKKIRAHDLSQLAYWHLSGGNPPGKIHPTKESTSQLITEALSGLKELINIFDDSKTPYLCVPRPSWAPKWNDYTHLARINEWGIQDLDDPNSE